MDNAARPGVVGLTSKTRESAGRREISFKGEVDVATVPVMHEAIERCFKSRPAVLVIDLTEVHFLAAVGILLLSQTRRRCQNGGISFEIRLSPPAQRILQVCCQVPGDVGALCRSLLSHQIRRPFSSPSGRQGAEDSQVNMVPSSSSNAAEGLTDRFVVDWAS